MGLMALKHRGKTATFGFLSRLYSLAGLGLRDLGEGRERIYPEGRGEVEKPQATRLPHQAPVED